MSRSWQACKLEKLKEARAQSCRENEVFLREFKIKESTFTLSDRHRKGIDKLKDLEAKAAGVDVERLQNLAYSLQDVEEWESRASQNAPNSSVDYTLKAWNSYASLVRSLGSISTSDGKESVRALAAKTDSNRRHVSKRRKFDEEQDFSFINLRNQKFNQKLERAYDIYTSNIRDGLAQG